MGQITAEALGAEMAVTPISSNSGIGQKGFARVIRTRIGSPFVIEAMQAGGRVAGYEANGGFLLGFTAAGPAGPIPPLLTRDAMLPLVMTLIAANSGPLSARVAQEPPVVTLADRLTEIPTECSARFLSRLSEDSAARAAFLSHLGGQEAGVDRTDGLRITLQDRRVVHLRPSGNAPEFRLYVEAATIAAAKDILETGLSLLQTALGDAENP